MYIGQAFILVWMSLLDLSQSQTSSAKDLVCPSNYGFGHGWFPCESNSWCMTIFAPDHICCHNVCRKGIKRKVVSPIQHLKPVPEATTELTTTSTTTPEPPTTTTTTTTPKPTTTSTTTTPKPTTTTTPKPTTTTTPKPTTTTTQKPTTTTKTPNTRKPKKSAKQTKVTSTRSSGGIIKLPIKPDDDSQSKYVCPRPGKSSSLSQIALLLAACTKNRDCRSKGVDMVCCEGRCVKGLPRPILHRPLLGIIPRECPAQPYGELLFELQQCNSDEDCWPRICCRDGTKSYCRTAHQRLDLVPALNRIDKPLARLEKYLQCSPPPAVDLFPKRCLSTMDCLPNLCCAEGGKRHCRPAQKSVLQLIVGMG